MNSKSNLLNYISCIMPTSVSTSITCITEPIRQIYRMLSLNQGCESGSRSTVKKDAGSELGSI